jgi:hypothetical protein
VAGIVTGIGTVSWSAASSSRSGAAPRPSTHNGSPSLASELPDQPLPDYVAAPPGPTNGALTAAEFASQSSDPAVAEAQFNSLADQPGAGATIRLWTDDGSGRGLNDVVELLFRIPDADVAAGFTGGLLAALGRAAGTTRFAVPSIPGARGFSLTVTTPVRATEQVVVFRSGPYVSMIQLASSASPSNPAPLTSAQAIAVSFQQLTTLRRDRSATGGSRPPTGVGATTATAASSESGWTALDTLLVGVALVVGSVVVTVIGRRRRRVPAHRVRPADAWGPDGILAVMGARPPEPPVRRAQSTASDRPLPVPDLGGTQPPLPVPDVLVGAGGPGADLPSRLPGSPALRRGATR